jgi:hypothetical protein
MSQNRTTSCFGPNDWGCHGFTRTFRDLVPHIIPPPCVPAKIGEVFFLAKFTRKMTLIWMAMSSYVTLAWFEMRVAGRIYVFMPSGVIV